MIDVEEMRLSLALWRSPGLGWVGWRKLVEEKGGVKEAWQSLELSGEVRQELLRWADEQMSLARTMGAELLFEHMPDYPLHLRQSKDRPGVLYGFSRTKPVIDRAVAVVGSRVASEYGIEVTSRLVRQLVTQGFTIVSGMAKGIDQIAHRSALEAGGKTVAVWGFGLDKAKQQNKQGLWQDIAEKGWHISQFGLGTEGQVYTFPQRNKVLAGVSLAVIVTEAGLKSGSLLTANAARQLSRPVFAVPGSVFHRGSQGTLSLIKQGADMVIDAADIVEKLGGGQMLEFAEGGPDQGKLTAVEGTINLSRAQLDLVKLLMEGGFDTDRLVRSSGRPVSEISSLLMELELQGVIRKVGEEWVVATELPT